LQNRLIQTGQTEGQWNSDTSPLKYSLEKRFREWACFMLARVRASSSWTNLRSPEERLECGRAFKLLAPSSLVRKRNRKRKRERERERDSIYF